MQILIVDDDPGLRQSLALLLGESGHACVAEGDPARALERARGEAFDAILCDVRMPAMDGLTFLRRYRGEGGEALVLMMSAYGNEDAAIAAMREGAYDYLHKPFRPDEVTLTLRKAQERERLRREVASLRASLGTGLVKDEVVAESTAMRKLLELAGRAAGARSTVLVTGESGTGKEVLARAVHRMSPRSEAPFVAVNCAAIPEHLLESELFGHVRGAFTGATQDRPGLFEAADEGTLFLDEIAELPPALQAKLLRVLEDGQIRRVGDQRTRAVDVRVVAATARPMEEAVRQGAFREDLFYRLNVIRLHLPPLRERPEDVPALVTRFAQEAARRLGRPVSLTPRALARLCEHSWPGNARELRNALERAATLSGHERLDADDFDLSAGHGGNGAGSEVLDLKGEVEAVEASVIRRALAGAGGNRREAAQQLGVSLRTLFYKIRKYGLS